MNREAVLDTSILIAIDKGDAGPLPGTYAVSVMSIAELHRGAISARTARDRAARIRRLAMVEELYEVIAVDRMIAYKFAELSALTAKLSRRPHVIDALIAATAIVHRVPVYTRDDDFDLIPEVVGEKR